MHNVKNNEKKKIKIKLKSDFEQNLTDRNNKIQTKQKKN